MLQAYEEAQKAAARGDYGIGAVIVLNGDIISRSGNEVITRGNVPYAHAEFLALDELRGTEFDRIDIYREMSVYTTLAPCPQCLGRMLVAGVKEIIYGAPDEPSAADMEGFIPEVFQETVPKVREIKGDLGKKCSEIFLATREEVDKKFFADV